MPNTEAVAGVDSYLLYGKETGYNVQQTTVNQHWGLITRFNPSLNNTNSYRRGFRGTTTGGRNVASYVSGKIDYGNTVDMEVLNWAFLEFVLGAVSGTTTKTYVEANNPPSFTMHRMIVNPGTSTTNQNRVWTGSVVESVTIRSSMGEPVTVSMNVKSAQGKVLTTTLTAVALPSVLDVFDFVGSSIELPDSTALPNIVESFEITITNNFDMRGGLGTRFTKNAKARARDYKVRFSVSYLDNALVQAVQGALEPTGTTKPTVFEDIVLKFALGSHTLKMTLGGFIFDSHDGVEDVNEILGEDLAGTGRTLTAVEVLPS